MSADLSAILTELLKATTPTGLRQLLTAIGDKADAQLNEPFGGMFKWVAVGNNPSNLSTIGLGTKPGRSLTERLTNAMDALLEDRAPQGISLPDSPRAAAQQWFGRPISSAETGLYKWDYSAGHIDRRIGVVLLPADDENAPTVDVIDDGIGISAARFGTTILSLQGGNKISKRYLIGAFGQGGSATLAFCDYAIIISRQRDDPEDVAFTVVRVLNLNETYKEECFAYLTLDTAENIVPSCRRKEPLRLYTSDLKMPEFARGTLARHIGYRLDSLTGSFGPSPGNLYHYFHAIMFDPLFPFRIYDLRGNGKDELVTGSRNRLMKLAGKYAPSEEESGSEIRHYRDMEYVVPLGEQDATIGIEYWVVLNYRKSKKDQVILRSQSNELYIQTGHPILGTLNGQNQGERTAQLLRDMGLVMVSRHMIVHIDASNATSRTRRQLFSTNREGFKDGPVLSGLLQVLRKMLEEDQNLAALEKELTEKVAQREAQTTSDEVRRQVTRLLLEAGYQVTETGPSFIKGGQEVQPVKVEKKGKPIQPEPLPTLPFPDVTRFCIVIPPESLSIRQNDIEIVLVETDADSEFDRRGLVAIRTEPSLLEVASKTPLRGGRIRWRLRTTGSAQVGQQGVLVAAITRPDGTQLTDSKPFVIQAPAEEKSRKEKGQVPPFDIIPINPDDNPNEWGVAWPQLGDDAPLEEQASVAYKPVKLTTGITVYYSTIFRPFAEQINKVKLQSAVLHDLFRTNYEIWIGYHAILQVSTSAAEADDKTEKLLEAERTHVAQMEVKQALKMAELLRQTLKEQVAEA